MAAYSFLFILSIDLLKTNGQFNCIKARWKIIEGHGELLRGYEKKTKGQGDVFILLDYF